VTDADGRKYWRVGNHADPVGFIPLELCAWNYRFDDVKHRFRSVYAAELAETAIREVLADLRPKAAAIRRYVEKFGPDAAGDVPGQPVTESWRQQHILVETRAMLEGALIDLCDANVRYEVELHHAELLDTHGMDHLDLSEITAQRRTVTQTIAADLHDRLGASGVRFPSRLDGNPCIALFEGRGALDVVAEPVALVVEGGDASSAGIGGGGRPSARPRSPPAGRSDRADQAAAHASPGRWPARSRHCISVAAVQPLRSAPAAAR
jgi:RES domain-containing protein